MLGQEEKQKEPGSVLRDSGFPAIGEQLGQLTEVMILEQSAMGPRGSKGWMGLG